MAKKQRRKQSRKSSGAPRQPAQAASSARTSSSPASGQSGPAEAPRTQRSGMTWAEVAERYSHVNRELKTVGIMAGSFLVVLLILSVVLG